MQPYLEKIDAEFIMNMNALVQNITMYMKSNLVLINDNTRFNSDFYQEGEGFGQVQQKVKSYSFMKILDNTESFMVNSGKIHMYQKDISGQNAIEVALEMNAIFCIRAFVDTLMILTDDVTFQNCFDKALLLMIMRGMDVKDLVNSELFYVSIWKDVPVFSSTAALTIAPYDGEIEDIEFVDPDVLFQEQDIAKGLVDSADNLRNKMKQGINKTFKKEREERTKAQSKEEFEM